LHTTSASGSCPATSVLARGTPNFTLKIKAKQQKLNNKQLIYHMPIRPTCYDQKLSDYFCKINFQSVFKTYFDMRFGVCITGASGVCWPCSDTQPSTILRMDDICHAPMPSNISAVSPGISITIHQAIAQLFNDHTELLGTPKALHSNDK